MFNKTIFKQTFKANFKIWLIVTMVLILMNIAIIGVFDPKTITSMTDMIKNTPLANMIEDTSFLGMLSQTLYSIQGIILLLIFIISVGGSLIVSQVDRGSMAYLLSTPIKRSEFVITQVTYFITSIFTMILLFTISGLISIQAFHGGILGKEYTKDIKATSNVLNIDKAEVADNLTLILDNDDAIKVGAEARDIDEDVYKVYLNLKITDNAYKAAAEIMNVDVSDISKDPSIVKSNDEALIAAAEIMGMDKDIYSAYLDKIVYEKAEISKKYNETQEKIFVGLAAASEVLDIEESDLASDMGQLKSKDEALDAAVNASGIPKEMFIQIINNQIASNNLSADNGIDFDVNDYVMINLGLFLLMFATSGITFMFSCIFNTSKNYIALGAGIPIAFFLFHMMAQVSDSLEALKYLSLNTLFDTKAILNGENYGVKLIILAVVAIVSYTCGMIVFKEKDLPL